MAHFFTSDWHLDHANIMNYSLRLAFMTPTEQELTLAAHRANVESEGRKRVKVEYSRASIDRMNSAIIDNINAVVGPDDILWNLGDVLFWRRKSSDVSLYDRLKSYRDRIVCKHLRLIWGNHDYQLRFESEKPKISKKEFFSLFEEVHEQKEITIEEQRITLNHYAMLTWNGNSKGAWQLYGHSHGNLEPWRKANLPNALQLDVGIDARNLLLQGKRNQVPGDYRPWSFVELAQFMQQKTGQPVDFLTSLPQDL
ncbi:Hypothetical protein PBC10988_24810 [Planctomycetales bacterium 10988]|nr:Hypothetical protein PBC10988_24810 [Planctomycetales bacterium 10988]